jgi:hypothetical protein
MDDCPGKDDMPTITQRLDVVTDASGAYSHTQLLNPPGPFPIFVRELRAKLLSPGDTAVSGTLDVNAVSGNPQNPQKSYSIPAGQEVSLGSWRLGGGENRLVISGMTSPPRVNTQLSIEVQATI